MLMLRQCNAVYYLILLYNVFDATRMCEGMKCESRGCNSGHAWKVQPANQRLPLYLNSCSSIFIHFALSL